MEVAEDAQDGRLFNTAGNICHYSRGRLSAISIQELMMFLYGSRFDVEEPLTFVKEFYSRDEIEAAKEEREDTPESRP